MIEAPRVIAQGKFLRMVQRGRWEYAERIGCQGAVVVVAITDAGCLLLTEQHRVPFGKQVIELPAGLAGDIPGDEHEAFAVAARRELLEETGYDAEQITYLTEGPISAGFGTESITFFLAENLRQVHPGGGDEHENIRVHAVPLPEVPEFLRQQMGGGILVDPKVYAGLYFAHHRGCAAR